MYIKLEKVLKSVDTKIYYTKLYYTGVRTRKLIVCLDATFFNFHPNSRAASNSRETREYYSINFIRRELSLMRIDYRA